MPDHFRTFARYNRWANRRLYDAAAKLTNTQYFEDRGAFFGSMHGTLNHLLTGDRIWMKRLTGEGDAPKALDAILHQTLDQLAPARAAEDQRIIAYADGLTESTLKGSLRFRTITKPHDHEQPVALLLAHFFNHQTHHRGQAHCLLTMFTGDAPSFDLLRYQSGL